MEHAAINIQVVNVDALERNTRPYAHFDSQGGTIGAAPNDHWYLYDRSGEVAPEHALITQRDDQFCVQQGAAAVYVNHADYPLGRDNLALLHDGDILKLGKFTLRVSLADEGAFNIRPNASLEEVVGDEEQNSLLVDPQWHRRERTPRVENVDPELALAQSLVISDSEDPEHYFQAQEQLRAERDELEELIQGVQPIAAPLSAPPRRQTTDNQPAPARVSPRPENRISKGVHTVKNDFSSKLEDLEDLVMGRGASPESAVAETAPAANLVDEAGHLAASPLQRGLGVSLKQSDHMQTHDVLEEIGETLREAVQGLLKIHGAERGQAATSSKVLQPIEDNPLRLGMDYTGTMAAMFDHSRSMVHLSAPMAVRESLHQIHLHQLATSYATAQALNAILQALDPSSLLRRFQRYRGIKGQEEVSDEGWAWQMYTHYYAELISSRQQGFEKLYSEVFEQAYDQRLRELQYESQDEV
ncbi:MAG: type VI secretion system-associated FHA domain protein TagH [Pseudomonadales bacterium]